MLGQKVTVLLNVQPGESFHLYWILKLLLGNECYSYYEMFWIVERVYLKVNLNFLPSLVVT